MNLLKRSEASNWANSTTEFTQKRFMDVLSEARCATRSSYTYSIFLSHSHHDADLVQKIVVILRSLGIRVYVDWLDDSMPKITCGETANRIKQKITENHKFIFLATNLSIESKWCNWEIGFGDAKKLPSNNIAIFPIAENTGTWNGNEYLQLYPCIRKGYANTNTLYIDYPDGRSELLTDWIRK